MRALLLAIFAAALAGCGSDGPPEPVGASAGDGASTIGIEGPR